MYHRVLILLALLVWGGTAQAEWREASSRNFIVYTEAPEATLRDFTERLERFDYVLRRTHNVQAPPSPNRLRIFLLPTTNAVGRMLGSSRSGVAGYYVTDARGMLMVGTSSSRNQSISAENVLLHEYTHHFMYQYFPATYPTWYSEGFAEFWGQTRLLPNDVIEVGHPSNLRLESFNPAQGLTRWLHVERLLTAQRYQDVPELDLLYSLGWLLVRYTWENPERRRQLQQYLAAVNDGSDYTEAARRSFGDLGRLNNELFEYAGRGRWTILQLPFRQIDIGAIAVRTPGASEQALLESEIRISQGVSNQDFADFAGRLRTTAARFPDDPYALRLLTEVERTAGNNAAAMAAADRLLAAAPNDPRGLMHRAMLQIDALRAASSTDAAAWSAARRGIARAAELSPADPILFEAYYDSFTAQGGLPPEPAQSALYRAHELAPSDSRLRYKVASDFERRGMIAEAIAVIRPDAYRVPARREETEREQQRRQRLEDRNRRAGEVRNETAREMLTRLQQSRPGAQPAASPAASPAATPAASGG